MKDKLLDPRKFVLEYLADHNITVNERGELQHISAKNTLQLFDTLWLDYLKLVSDVNKSIFVLNEDRKRGELKTATIIPLKDKVLQTALNELIVEQKLIYRANLMVRFKCAQENLEPLLKYVEALTGRQDKTDVTALAHWMWQVKVKMANKSPSYHLMPIFFGKQEGGKTVALNKLIAPINNFRLNINLDQMGDDRYFRAMSENYVIVFDEMQGAQRTDIDALKKQVTIDYNDYRPLGTNEIFKVRQSCSFIGATNRPVSEQIVDSTGMRRFWQLNCLDRLNWTALNEINYTEMWQGIDELRKDGYVLDSIEAIRAVQENMVAKDELQAYLDLRGIVVDTQPTRKLSSAEFYADYKQWAQDNGFRPLNSSWWARKLSNKGLKAERMTLKTTTYNYYEINIDANLSKSIIFDASEGYSHLVPINGNLKPDEVTQIETDLKIN